MSGAPSFAYSLCQEIEGWRWCVYDEEGVTVARGAGASRDMAQAAVELTLRSAEARQFSDVVACGPRRRPALRR